MCRLAWKKTISLQSEAHEKTRLTGAIAENAPCNIEKRGDNRWTQFRVFKEYVNTIMSDKPLRKTDHAYYPTVMDINIHVTKAKSALQFSKLDQQNLHLNIQEWKKIKSRC